jgi:hypothetical protein
MNRHSSLLFVALCAASIAGGLPAKAQEGGDSRLPAYLEDFTVDPVSTGRFTVSVAVRGSEAAVARRVARVNARVERYFGSAVLVDSQTVRGRRGARTLVLVYALPKAGASPDYWSSYYKKVAGGAKASHQTKRIAKGKPVTLPIFQSDWDGRAVRTQPALTTVAADVAQLKATGAGRVVAVLDGGFDLHHEFLAGRLSPMSYDTLDNDVDAEDLGNGINDDAASEPADDRATDRIAGHGTFVASILLSTAPDATILPIRVLDDEGWGTDLSVAAGISYAIDNGVDVINMSLVLPSSASIVKDAVRAAVDAGIVVVSAAGTETDSWQRDATVNKKTICVGATDVADYIPEWSDDGTFVHVFAPGVMLQGALGGRGRANSYGWWSGTSFSTPILSAGAAMIRENRGPSVWTSTQVRDALINRPATAYEDDGDPARHHGRVQLDLAVPADQ